MFTCAVSVTELEPGIVTEYHCRRGHPSAVVTDAGAGRAAPVDSELPPATSAVSYVPFSRIVSMVAAPAAELVMTRRIVEVPHEGDSVAAVAVADRVRGLVGVGSVTATEGSDPLNLTCVPEAMYAIVLTRATPLLRVVLVGTSVMVAVYAGLLVSDWTVVTGTRSALASVVVAYTIEALLMRYAPDGQRGSVIADTKNASLSPMVPPSPVIVTANGTPIKVDAEDEVIAAWKEGGGGGGRGRGGGGHGSKEAGTHK
jgi:hypothetical protein